MEDVAELANKKIDNECKDHIRLCFHEQRKKQCLLC